MIEHPSNREPISRKRVLGLPLDLLVLLTVPLFGLGFAVLLPLIAWLRELLFR